MSYIANGERTEGLLFPAENGGMLRDVRESLGNGIEKAKITKPVTLLTLRHTYASARLQTLDGGEPVSVYTVMREMGHSSLSMIERHYGHVMTNRLRRPVVDYVDNVVAFPQEKKALEDATEFCATVLLPGMLPGTSPGPYDHGNHKSASAYGAP